MKIEGVIISEASAYKVMSVRLYCLLHFNILLSTGLAPSMYGVQFKPLTTLQLSTLSTVILYIKNKNDNIHKNEA